MGTRSQTSLRAECMLEKEKTGKESKRRGASLLGWSKSAGKGEQAVKRHFSPGPLGPHGDHTRGPRLVLQLDSQSTGSFTESSFSCQSRSGFPAPHETRESLMQLNGRHRKEVRNENHEKPTIPSPVSPPSARPGKAKNHRSPTLPVLICTSRLP